MAENDIVRWIPFGGLGEIGLNCMAFECRDRIVMIDSGSMFPEDHMPGVDLVIPDIRYILERADKLAGIVLTHGHEDHIGALPYLLPRLPRVPVYGAPFTIALVREKLAEHRLDYEENLRLVHAGDKIELGPFTIECIRVCHSIADGLGLAVDTPAGTVIHSGDFKFDPSPVGEKPLDIQAFSRYGERGVRLLFSDSTNVEREGYCHSESRIQDRLEEVFRHCTGRIIVSTFSSNIQRIREVVHLTRKFGRKLYLNGRSMVTAVRLATELKYLSVPESLLVESAELEKTPNDRLVVLTTGSQGEPLSALSLMAGDRHKWLKVDEGDTVVFSSRFIPGNEKAIYTIINSLSRKGAKVIYEPLAQVHVSGHASREELKLMVHLTRPEYFIPIHGEYRHLIQHVELAKDSGVEAEKSIVAENGDVFILSKDGLSREGHIETGRIFVDGKGVGDIGETVLRDRKHLSADGMVVALVVLDKATGETISRPELFSRGFVFDEGTIMEEAQEILKKTISEFRQAPEGDPPEDLQAEIRRVLKSHFWRSIRRRPMIMPLVVEL